MTSRPPCGRPTLRGGCNYPRMKGKQMCLWHWLLRQPADVQDRWAQRRQELNATGEPVKTPASFLRSSADERGERWCSDCQTWVPLFYTTGSKCKAHASKAAHSARVAKVYGITGKQYDELFAAQGGRCFICGRKSIRRLAVDHDHDSGAVRGLLCPDPDRGCNHKVLGLLEANSVDGGLAAARRLVEYLEHSPADRVARGEKLRIAHRQAAEAPPGYTGPPPF